jgi:hypothetical protein
MTSPEGAKEKFCVKKEKKEKTDTD